RGRIAQRQARADPVGETQGAAAHAPAAEGAGEARSIRRASVDAMPAILLADDEPAIRESLAFALRRDGFEVSQAATLREARPLAGAVDLLILDLVLPDGNGLEFLRSLPSRSDVPVIVFPSRAEQADRVVGPQ